MEDNRKTFGEAVNEVFNDYFNKSVEYSEKIDKLLKEDYLTTSKVQRYFIIGYAKAAILIDELIDLGYLKERNSKLESRIKKEFTEEIKKYIYEYLIFSKK